jgi:segregation and condensation protein A
VKTPEYSATLYDLLTAYASQRQRTVLSRVRFKKRTVWSLAEARATLARMIGESSDWSRIDSFLIASVVEPAMAATVFASSFASALELVREGHAEIHQKESFAPLYMRKRVGMNRGASAHDAQENA